MAELNIPLEVFGQQPGLNGLYTQICNFYPVEDASEYPIIIKTLQAGLEALATSFPWIAGQTVNESGIVSIKALERIPRLIVKDLRNDPSVAEYEVFRQARFPFSMLDEGVICPRNTLPTMPSETPLPVFLVQANLVKGGILLCFVGQHNCMDMTGQGQMIHLLSKACRNEFFTPEELRTGNFDRKNLVPLLTDSYEPGPEVERQIVKPPPPTAVSGGTSEIPVPPPIAPNSVWAYFIFSGTSLAEVKQLAMDTLPPGSSFVSTDDALTAFIWKVVSRARLARLAGTKTSILARAIDARRYINVPTTYPGILTNMAYNDSTLQTAVDESLGLLAAQLRSVLDPKTSGIGYRTRALATLIARSEDKSQYNITANMDFSSDIMLSSWSKVDSYNDDFGTGQGVQQSVLRYVGTVYVRIT
ncbi:hypothetical protein BCR34DRAFT_565389 [Clohesyomyces aquaticus]|uniref:Trichothecene 3-O-acetyltransferase-like N-terminal domain-containing protein n=1 Tax=Clohesyomyces aquaticus TaxID=1231657 RepID=A0A1Y1ZM21_9PLEO|nr:hypothetical protein BCR34DRAFT_565389 [Clohesyomyces aquaticus]